MFRYLTVFEVQIHLPSAQKCQETLRVTEVICSHHGFCAAAEFLREGGIKGSAAMRREGAGQRGQQGAASTTLVGTNTQIWLYSHKAASATGWQAHLKKTKYYVTLIF